MDGDKMEGIRGAVLEAYRVYADELSRTALALTRNKALAQDVLQETFLRYFVTRMHDDEISDEGRWLHGVMRSLIQDWKKSAVGQEALTLEEVEDTAEQTPQDKGFGGRQRTLPAWAARILAPREQECIELRSQGLAYSEIASAMQISIGTVGALLNRAISKLRHTLPIIEAAK
jgi:RNA polymerase sigma-70 factor (ECF subfamily)